MGQDADGTGHLDPEGAGDSAGVAIISQNDHAPGGSHGEARGLLAAEGVFEALDALLFAACEPDPSDEAPVEVPVVVEALALRELAEDLRGWSSLRAPHPKTRAYTKQTTANPHKGAVTPQIQARF